MRRSEPPETFNDKVRRAARAFALELPEPDAAADDGGLDVVRARLVQLARIASKRLVETAVDDAGPYAASFALLNLTRAAVAGVQEVGAVMAGVSDE